MDRSQHETDKKFNRGLIELLSPERISSEVDLVILASAIKNTDPTLFDDMINYLKKTKLEYSDETLKTLWDTKTVPRFSVSTLKYWAYADSREPYLRLVADTFKDYTRGNFAYSLARFAMLTYGHLIKTYSIGSGCGWWKCVSYVFANNRWRVCKCGDFFPNLDIKFGLMFQIDYLMSLVKPKPDTVSGRDGITDTQYQVLIKLRNMIDNYDTVMGISKAIEMFTYTTNRRDIMDSNTDIIGFNDGVYDVSLRSYRQSTPDDMFSLSVGYEYPKDVLTATMMHDGVTNINNYLKQVFVDDTARENVLAFLEKAITLKEQPRIHLFNPNKISSGVTTFLTLIRSTFDDYCVCLRPSEKCDFNRYADRFKDTRVVIYEISTDDFEYPSNVHVYRSAKRTVGSVFNDIVQFHRSHPEIECTVIIVLEPDQSIPKKEQRQMKSSPVVIHNFESSFVDHPDPSCDREFKRDVSLSDKIVWEKKWSSSFLSLLLARTIKI